MKKFQLIILSLEPLQDRYTSQWFTHLPKVFQEKLGSDWEIKQINGETTSKGCSLGGFLDFAATNAWKSEQIKEFFLQFDECSIQDDAVILFTDAWHPGILQVKYTKDLLKKNWKLVSFFHAGSYIPEDPLGQLIEDKSWSLAAERSFYEACDINVFATQHHLDFFFKQFPGINTIKALRSGFPMEYIYDICFPKVEKENLIVFAARNSPEKHPELFELLAHSLPEYQFVNCQEQNMTKTEYHETLAKAKIVLSFAELETMGICTGETLAAKGFPLCPDWLCYSEQLGRLFLYDPCNITTEFTFEFIKKIKHIMENFDQYNLDIKKQSDYMMENFYSVNILIKALKSI